MKRNLLFTILFAGLIGLFFIACDNPVNGPGLPADKVVTDLSLNAKVTAPVKDVQPNTTPIQADQYTGTIAWQTENSGAHTGVFAASTVYKAVVTLTPNTGFTFAGVAANSFIHTAATTVTNPANSGTVTITFPATAAEGQDTPINDLSLNDKVTAPVRNAQPDTTPIQASQYTGTIAWQTENGGAPIDVFAASTVYKAVVTLTPNTGFTFDGVAANSFVYSGATVTNPAGSGTVTITFPPVAGPGSPPPTEPIPNSDWSDRLNPETTLSFTATGVTLGGQSSTATSGKNWYWGDLYGRTFPVDIVEDSAAILDLIDDVEPNWGSDFTTLPGAVIVVWTDSIKKIGFQLHYYAAVTGKNHERLICWGVGQPHEFTRE
jgi:hypothetical protein